MAVYHVSAVSYDIPGAAAATGLSESLLRHHIRNGDIAVRYAGAKNTKPVIEREELEAFVNALPSTKE